MPRQVCENVDLALPRKPCNTITRPLYGVAPAVALVLKEVVANEPLLVVDVFPFNLWAGYIQLNR
jgi:hypothetical protein